MTTFLCTWDGGDAGYPPLDYARDIQRSSGGNDRVFLLRQKTQRGIVASGHLRSGEIYGQAH